MTDRDWRGFRELRERARERFAEETLAQALQLALDEAAGEVQRELRLERLLAQRRQERRALFEDSDRAKATMILHLLVAHDLLQAEELDGLSLEVRRAAGVAV
ncbi:hypothetical protein WM2015_2171 [Wenzhouxiangella marina]|uniref:Uncharacterized protein n=2 Tax=Wenzhouxiangella marina TaxID=1579979 RepID=A0A0K0XXV6_9GAMM|nr:hypothetical protein WM2015_2171 [Wenzhouxiangella marina]